MISSRDNARVKSAKALKQAKARAASDRILVEGVRLLADACSTGVRPDLVFWSHSESSWNGAALLDAMRNQGVECVEVTPHVLADLSDTVTPQGIIAVVPMPRLLPPQHADLLLILDGVREPGNAGALLRSAEAAGVRLVLFGPASVDPFNSKVLRAAMGAHFRLPILEPTTSDELESLIPEQLSLYFAEARAGIPYDQVNWRSPSALIIGGEADGPSQWSRQRGKPIHIPMASNVESLNAAVAGAVILFESARQRRLAALP
jgi:TrmH family RNA methyltransferase